MTIKVTLHKNNEKYEGEVKENTNLVVKAAIRDFPYPHLSYLCGMGRCGTCACKVLSGGEHLAKPNWKERKRLGDSIKDGHRLMCQLWVTHDIEITQDIEPGTPDREYQAYLAKQGK